MRWYQRFFRRELTEKHLDAELQFHLEQRTADLVAAGMTPEEARRRAQLEFGGLDQVKEECRDVGAAHFLETLIQDFRYGLRTLAKSPGFTIVAVLILALGIGANTAIFSLMNALLLRSLPVRDPQQLVAISTISAEHQNGEEPLSLLMYEEIRKQQVFSNMFAWSGGGMANYEANGVKYAASLDTVSGDYFSTLGVQPLLGRLIAPVDVALEAGSSAPVAVISYACWQRRYNGDPSVVGRSIRVEDRLLTIIGVTPRNFTGMYIEGAPDAFVPIGFTGRTDFRKPENLWLSVVGRLRSGTTLEQARAQLTALWPSIQAATVPPTFHVEERVQFFKRRIEVASAAKGNSFLRRRFAYPLRVLMGLVGLVLLLCCANLANLTLARAAARQHEIGIRVALGAGAWRLVRHLLTESALLAAAGLGMGLAFAWWNSPLLADTMWTGFVPLDLDLRPDLHVLAFAASIAVVTTLLCGLAPAWHAMRTNPAIALQQNPRTLGSTAPSLGKLLVSAQVALSLIVVVGAALFVRSLEKLRSVDPGFRRRGILLVLLFPQAGHEKIPNRTSYYQELAAKVSQLPGVEAASYSHMGPLMDYEYKVPVSAPSLPSAPDSGVIDWVGPGFFHLIGMRLLEGREFDWHDDEQAPEVAIISESLAKQLFPRTRPVGRKIDVGLRPNNKSAEIVGVVNSASLWKLQSREPMAVYIPLMQWAEMNTPMLDLRIAGNPRTVAPAVTRAIESLGHHFPLLTQSLEEREDMILIVDRMIAMLSSFFGGLALLLASLGLYGLMSYAVTRRTSEMGVRRALGAQQDDIAWMIVREALVLVAIGISIGLPIALAATHLVSSTLFGLKPMDPSSIGLATVLLTAVALLAAYLPARRASRVDPMVALRYE